MIQDETKKPEAAGSIGIELDELIAYREGRMTAAEEDAVRAKLVASPAAVDQLLALDEVAQQKASAVEDPSTSDVEAAWKTVEARLDDRVVAASKFEEPIRNSAANEDPRRWLLLAAAFALAALGLAVASAWLWLDRRSTTADRDSLQRQVAALSGPQVNVAVVELYPPGWARGFGNARGFDLPADVAMIHVLLNLPQPAAGEVFSLRISDAADVTIWQAEGLVATIENAVAFTLRTEPLEPGRYRLLLSPPPGSSGLSTVEYDLEID